MLTGNSCLFGGLGHLENVGGCSFNSPYNRSPLIHEVRRQDDGQNVCMGMIGVAEVEFGLDLQGKCQ